jgi:hypothetical protein
MTQTTYQIALLRAASSAGRRKETGSAVESEMVDDGI